VFPAHDGQVGPADQPVNRKVRYLLARRGVAGGRVVVDELTEVFGGKAQGVDGLGFTVESAR